MLAAALEAGVRRVVLISSTAVYGVPETPPDRRGRPARTASATTASRRSRPRRLARAFGRRGLEVVIVRPKTFIGPERLGVFEILFDWIREGRRIPILGDGANRYQLLAVEDLVDAVVRSLRRAPVAGEALNVGATEFGTVRDDLQALIDHAGSELAAPPGPGAPGRARAARARARAALAARRVALQDGAQGLVRRDREGASGCSAGSRASRTPRRSARTYDWYLAHLATMRAPPGTTHRVPWDQQALGLKRLSLHSMRELPDYRAEFPILETRRT